MKDSCLVREGILKSFKRKDNLLSLSDLLDNRKGRILNTIINLEELRIEAIEELEKAKACLREVEADKFRVNGYYEIKRENLNLVNLTYKTLKQLENFKNETIKFKRQRTIDRIQQQVFQQALQGVLGTFNSCFTTELHLRTISINIEMLGTAIKEIID